MLETPLISVALCTYNAGKFLERQLLSILGQTYQHIEIVVVDDCSTDGTYEYLVSLENQYAQLKLFRNEFNLGFNKNFEKAISLCKGDFIAISDQDDIWLPEKLAVLLDNIGENWLIFSNSELIDANDNQIGAQLLQPTFSIKGETFKSIILKNAVTGHTTLFAKEFVSFLMPIPAIGYYDWWMGFVAFYHNKITYLNRCLTLYRVHKESVIGSINNAEEKRLKEKIKSDLSTQLSLFATYKSLETRDRVLIKKISKAYDKKNRLSLIGLLVSQYSDYLPNEKPRNWLGRFFFALKFK